MDGVEHSFDTIFKTTQKCEESIWINGLFVFRESQYTETILIEWDIYTGGVVICDDNGFNACEISSAILEEGITIATNIDLANNGSKDDLTRFGLIEADSYENDKFELYMDGQNHIQIKYLGTDICLPRHFGR